MFHLYLILVIYLNFCSFWGVRAWIYVYILYVHTHKCIYTYIRNPVSGRCESPHCCMYNYAYIYIYTYTGTPLIPVSGSQLSGAITPRNPKLGLSAFLHQDYLYIYNSCKYTCKYVYIYMHVDWVRRLNWQSTGLSCGRSWVQTPVESNQ